MRRLAPGNVARPATLVWRVYEVEAIVEHADLAGRGVDIGCGDGQVASAVFDLQARRPDVIGIDPDPLECELARQSGAYSAVHCAPGHDIPEPDGSFDFAFSNSTLEHIADLHPVFAEVRRLLRPGGRFVFTVPSEQFHACLRGSRLLSLLARRRGLSYTEWVDSRLRHFRYLDPDAWTAALTREGFASRRLHRYLPARAIQTWESLTNMTGGIVYELAGGRRLTRRAFRRMRRPSGGSSPRAVVARALSVLLAPTLGYEIHDGEPSGGLLIVAERA